MFLSSYLAVDCNIGDICPFSDQPVHFIIRSVPNEQTFVILTFYDDNNLSSHFQKEATRGEIIILFLFSQNISDLFFWILFFFKFLWQIFLSNLMSFMNHSPSTFLKASLSDCVVMWLGHRASAQMIWVRIPAVPFLPFTLSNFQYRLIQACTG